jgi:hypothetical protein
MMSFKFFKGKEDMFSELGPMQTLSLRRDIQEIEDVEFCFQFGDEEPVVFATGPNECHIHLNPRTNSNMTFTDNDREFKLFARERQ